MAHGKVRALHPDFFSDDDLAEVSIPARLLFAGLWCFCCDNGHVPDRSKQIKRWVYATDDVNVAELLRELVNQGLVERGDGWLTVPNLARRQRIDWRYFKTCEHMGCEKPARAGSDDSEPETRRGSAGKAAPSNKTRYPRATKPATDGDGDGDGDKRTTFSSLAADAEKKPRRATQRPADFRPTQAHIVLAAERGVDLRNEWAKFCDWCDANGKTYKDWSAALRNWIRNARPAPSAGSSQQPSRVQQHLRVAADLAAEAEAQTIPFPQIGSER